MATSKDKIDKRFLQVYMYSKAASYKGVRFGFENDILVHESGQMPGASPRPIMPQRHSSIKSPTPVNVKQLAPF